jgi:hypothetical protein
MQRYPAMFVETEPSTRLRMSENDSEHMEMYTMAPILQWPNDNSDPWDMTE